MKDDLINERLRSIGADWNHEDASKETLYEGWALPLLASWPKVLSVLDGEIPTPEVVEIFPTNHCNLKCPHCRFIEHHGSNSEHLSLGTIQTLLEELKSRGVTRLEISGGGEPLEHPNAQQIFELIHKMGFRVGLITNAYSMVVNSALIEPVLACTDWIRISVDGFTDKTYRKVHGKSTIRYPSLRETIQNLIRYANDKPKIGLKMLLSKLNVSDAELAIPEGLDLGADYIQFKYLGFPSELALSGDGMRSTSDKLTKQISEYKNAPIHIEFVPPFDGKKSYERCLMTFLHPVIDWDGTIYLCAFFEHRKKSHSIGNIKEGGFFTHWDNSEHQKVFKGIDPLTCLPNCPMRRYNPIIAFMVRNDFRKGYI